MKILSAVSEIYPLIKTGGLGDVVGALPAALKIHGVAVVTLVPGYPQLLKALDRAQPVLEIADLFGGRARVLRAFVSGLDLFVIDAPHLYDRPGTPYANTQGEDWPDNALRFGALSWMAARIGLGDIPEFVPDVVHCHDWQAGLVPVYIAFAGARVATVITIHNLAYQGKFPAHFLSALRLPQSAFSIHGVEYYGGIGFLKAALRFADRITTVSPTYAAEILTSENGLGLEGLLRSRSAVLTGIANGIDTKVWDPENDERIPVRFGPQSLSQRAYNTSVLRQRFGLSEGQNRILMAVVSRLVWQKGLDLLADAVPALLAQGMQFAILGTGDSDLEQRLRALGSAYPGQVGCIIGYDEDLAHLVQAGADGLFIPSRFEPCGITQLCAMRYGAVPVAAKVGGLADTVTDVDCANGTRPTGFHISPVTTLGIEAAGQRVMGLWGDRTRWQRLQQNGMSTDVSWTRSAGQYASLYADLVAAKSSHPPMPGHP